ncbi:MAG TPA: protein kinase [Bryobacteraceae bacterium]|nr:protein kinase [Bryobacteraceae bacterium]
MPLSVGDKLGPYEILASIGKGGMGEVYRAHDSRLNRDVAIKVSNAEFTERFTREARSIAALNHTNICHLYDVGPNYLVMEYVEGPDLRGPLAFEDALPIIQQLIDGIEAAHEKNIIHRDLKPANIKITPEGVVKILDFGLAKAMEPPPSQDGNPENSPTLTIGATQAGTILGTAAYMAPEQAKGKAADKRCDIWSFGVILYEVLTGKRLFQGESAVEILGAVLNKEPDISAAPRRAQNLLRWCLEKDRKQRLASISDARRLLIRDSDGAEIGAEEPAPLRSWLGRAGWIVAAVVAIAAAAFGLRSRPAALQKTETRLTIPLPPGQEIISYPAITRDGKTVAYVAQQGTSDAQLYLRDLNAFEARAVPGASGARQPFFSPDGKWVAFFAQGQLQKAEVAGGAPIRLAEIAVPFGGTWNEDNTVIYAASLNSGLLRIPASGGTPESLTKPDGAANGYAHAFPQALPGGRNVLFAIWGQTQGNAVLSLDSRQWEIVLPEISFGFGVFDPMRGSIGRLLVVDQSASMMAAPFDAAHPARTSAETTVLANVYYDVEREDRGWLAVSNTGTAVYAPGNPAKTSLVWVDREGKIESLGKDQDLYRELSLSPDGTKTVVRHGYALWIHDLQRGTHTPLTSGNGNNLLPLWSRDGTRIIFSSNRGGDWDLYSQPADGSRPAEALLKRPYDQYPLSILADGTLLYVETHPKTGRDLWILAPDGKTSPLRVTPFNEMDAQFSPDAGAGPRRWVAYSSDESGRAEIYVQSYPGGTNRIPISMGGGMLPKWSRDGKELFYVTGDAVVAVAVRPDGSFGAPRRLFDRPGFYINTLLHEYDVSPDGKRFLMIQRDPGSVPRQLNVILNWSGH